MTPMNEDAVIDALSKQIGESYILDENGNSLGSLPAEVASIEVV